MKLLTAFALTSIFSGFSIFSMLWPQKDAVLPTYPYSSVGYDKYGGWQSVKSNATGFFRTEQINGVWWFITPEGNAFISKGFNAAGLKAGNKSEPGMTVNFLKGVGANTAGAWSPSLYQKGLPYAVLIDMVKSYAAYKHIDVKDKLPDIFSKDLENFLAANQKRLEAIIKPLADDPYMIGWWTDNELRWAKEYHHILDTYLKLPAGAEGRKTAEEYLRRNFGEPVLPEDEARLQEARDGFLELAVRRYAQITTGAVRQYDKNHLILGSRLFFTPSKQKNILMPERMGGFEAIARGAKGYWDVISINVYFDETPLERARILHSAFGGPILISEFNINIAIKPQGKFGEAEWQAKAEISARGYENQMPSLLSEPYIIGYHWFPYRNYPVPVPNNNRPGIISYYFKPRDVIVSSFRKVNSLLEKIHCGSQCVSSGTPAGSQ